MKLITLCDINADAVKIDNPQIVYDTFLEGWDKRIIHLQMQVKVMFLNSAKFPLGIYTHTSGLSQQSAVDVRIITSIALKANAHSIILASNRPSCFLEPSIVDQQLMNQLQQATSYFNIEVLDFLLLSEYDCFSFTQNELLYGL